MEDNVEELVPLSGSSAENQSSDSQRQEWEREQEQLKSRVILYDDFTWTLPPRISSLVEPSLMDSATPQMRKSLQYIGGVDLSFSRTNSAVALGALVVLDLDSLEVVFEKFEVVHLKLPYIPGFLAFRECPVIVNLLSQMASSAKDLYPQLLMVDGNGILHPKGFGLASHLGVLVDIPTIGVGKNLHHVDGLTDTEVRLEASRSNVNAGDTIPLIGKSGKIWGVALKSHESSSKPIFVSIGHRICLESATAVVQSCCRYRVPEPIRQVIHTTLGRRHYISDITEYMINDIFSGLPLTCLADSFNMHTSSEVRMKMFHRRSRWSKV